MEIVKIQRALQSAVLIVITVVCLYAVIVAVSHNNVTYRPVEDGTTARPVQQSEPDTSEPQTTRIRYDDYTPSEIDEQSFEDTVIIGNSQAEELLNYGIITNADYVARVGLAVHQVLSDSSGEPPIAKIYGNHYSNAVFVFGENELGWPYPENFITHYKKVIEKVRELNPDVTVFCHAIFPVSTEYSETSTNGSNNENVVKYNKMIEKMCEEIDAIYLPVSDAFFDENGALPEEITTDGVHFTYEYCKIWAGDLSAYLNDPSLAQKENP